MTTTPLQYGIAGDRPYSLYYQHSGRTPIGGVILAALAGCVVAVIAAAAYAYVDLYIPIIYLNLLATLAFGAVMGFVTAAVLKRGRVRSMPIALALVLVITLVGYYFSWVFWIKAAFDRFADPSKFGQIVTVPHLIGSPRLLAACVEILNKSGTWAMSRHDKENVSGVFLGLIWLAEAGAIFVVSIKVARSQIGEQIFCERCNRWCGKPISLGQTAPGDAQIARQSAESHDFAYFGTLGPATAEHFWDLEYDRCLVCRNLHTLTLRDFKITVDRKGNKTIKQRPVVHRLFITEEEANAIRQSRQPAPTALVATATPTPAVGAPASEPLPELPPPPPPAPPASNNPLLPDGQ